MAKILLVEDDNNLREIYQARLEAEGYETTSAQDGEEALVVAKQEKPDLVISDVMMPKISGFEMLDILRNTQGLEDTKVIMLTALGQAEDRQQADSLGADKYLVKSQVTLEDIVKTAHELLGGDDGTDQAASDDEDSSASTETPTESSSQAETPSEPAPAPEPEPSVQPQVQAQPVAPAPAPVPEPPTEAPAEPAVEPASSPATEAGAPEQPAQPEPSPAPALEEASSTTPTPTAANPANLGGTAAQEEADVNKQIDNFVNQSPPSSPPEPTAPDTGSSAQPAGATPSVGANPATTQSAPAAPDSTAQSQSQPTDNQTSDDKLMADAVNQLAGDDKQATGNASGQPGSPTANNPASSASTNQPSDNQEVAPTPGRKVISPVQQEAKPSIHELLAKEEGTSSQPAGQSPAAPAAEPQAGSMPTPSVPPQQPTDTSTPQVNPGPASASTPQPGQPSNPDNQQDGFDPNSVTL